MSLNVLRFLFWKILFLFFLMFMVYFVVKVLFLLLFHCCWCCFAIHGGSHWWFIFMQFDVTMFLGVVLRFRNTVVFFVQYFHGCDVFLLLYRFQSPKWCYCATIQGYVFIRVLICIDLGCNIYSFCQMASWICVLWFRCAFSYLLLDLKLIAQRLSTLITMLFKRGQN